MQRPGIITLVLSGSLFVAANAEGQFSRTGTPSVVFTAAGPAGMKIEGKTGELDVTESNSSVKVSVKLAGLDTGIALRNKHMREKYLETDKFPTADLVVDRASLQSPQDGSDAAASAQAQITIHGQTKPVTIRYQAHRTGKAYDVQGTTHVNMNDFGISVPSYLGVTVKPDVDIAVRFSMLDS